MSSDTCRNHCGILSPLIIFQLTFVVLKFTHIITWSWWRVLIPLYIWIAFYILAIIITYIVARRVHKDTQERLRRRW